ncbi:AAA family ATPase [Pseudomonas sp. LS1212]|uniref:AAA family ATPase n=1 Tax=Pseudomonas sp. LS1212 TaxID=2972478 RepID=UPI00215C9E14|nr:AAA family ATPase [Pseudomonas sp. LS1212]UVJ43914.1 AAA family ATPase [Pseudomonas sp. LS1212]
MNSLYIREIRLKPSNIPHPWRDIFPIKLSNAITIIMGENGCGKSTLLESIAIKLGCNPEGGSKNFMFQTQNTHSDLHNHLQISKGHLKEKDLYFYRAETFYNLNTEIRRLDEEKGYGPEIKSYYGGRDLHTVSHGEAMEALFKHRFRSQGLYILDEPEASLSPLRQLSFIQRITDLAQSGSQFLIATHSPILMFTPGSELLQILDGELVPVVAQETEAFSIYKAVLNTHGAYLKKMLGSP